MSDLLDDIDEEAWRDLAACRGVNVELFFPGRGEVHSIRAAKACCSTCPVAPACLEDAIADEPGGFGVWAGTTARDRQRLRRLIRESIAASGPQVAAPTPADPPTGTRPP
jgi:hypothetical protein